MTPIDKTFIVNFILLPGGKKVRARKGHHLKVHVQETSNVEDLLLDKGVPNWPHKEGP